MIHRFLSSKLSGYIALVGLVMIFALVWYIYNAGQASCVAEVAQKQVVNEVETKKGTDNVKRRVQGLKDSDVVRELCNLGIMRENRGCE